MSYTSNIQNPKDYNEVNAEEFINILRGNNSIYLSEDYEKTIQAKNIIVNEDVFLYEEFIFSNRINIESTFFKGVLWFSKGLFTNYVSISECFFDKGIYFEGGEFQKDLFLNQLSIKEHVTFRRGTFDKVQFNGNDLKKLTIYYSNFKEFELSSRSQAYDEIVILNNDVNNITGNINIANTEIGKLYIGGFNSGSNFSFENLNCDHISINDFENLGAIKFNGINAIKNGKEKNFEIIKSNLDKAQFFRINFDSFKEVNIFDSLITTSSFINVKWGKKIGAFYGPGFSEEMRKKTITPKVLSQVKETYRQLKTVMAVQHDSVNELKFHALEMETYLLMLPWSLPYKESFWTKLIIYISKTFTSFGQSFLKPLIWLFAGNLFLFSLLVYFCHYQNLSLVPISQNNPEVLNIGVGEFLKFINPLRTLNNEIQGSWIGIDLLSRIYSSFLIFSLIRVSRRFVK